MPFLHDQIGGGLWYRASSSLPWKRIAIGYAGNGDGQNNPAWQAIHNQGPLPVGNYTLVPVDVPHLGGNVFRLDPSPANTMFGRSAFFLHWKKANRDLTASDGCICHGEPETFVFIAHAVTNGDTSLQVAAMPPLADPPTPAPPPPIT
jgi:hypothetical protein